jgi:SAM-dependent methyltransferase
MTDATDPAHTGWSGSMPDDYDRLLGPVLFEPYAADLARRVAAAAPRRILELAAGTGAVTHHLVSLAGVEEVVATDLNEAMVHAGEQRVPDASWRVANAVELPFDDAGFDAVACQFGVMFFPDKPAALSQARRVLTAGGWLHFSTWRSLVDNDFAAAVSAAVHRLLPDLPPDFLELVPYGYADPEPLMTEAEAAGFVDVSVKTVVLASPPVPPRDVAAGFCLGTPLGTALAAQGDLTALTAAVVTETERILGDAPLAGRMAANVFTARAG